MTEFACMAFDNVHLIGGVTMQQRFQTRLCMTLTNWALSAAEPKQFARSSILQVLVALPCRPCPSLQACRRLLRHMLRHTRSPKGFFKISEKAPTPCRNHVLLSLSDAALKFPLQSCCRRGSIPWSDTNMLTRPISRSNSDDMALSDHYYWKLGSHLVTVCRFNFIDILCVP